MKNCHMKNAMELAGNEHRYQKIVITILCFSWILGNLMLLSSTYVFMHPVFECEENLKEKFHEVEACEMLKQCGIKNDFTLTADMKLYCDLGSKRVLIQSIFPIGCFIGLFFVNLLSDTRGRKFAFQLALSICLAGLLCGESSIMFYLILGQFTLGFGSSSIIPLGYTILYDFLSDSYRPVALVIINSVGGFATLILGVSYLMSINWFNFLLIFIIIPLIVLLAIVYFFLQESPYILMNRNQPQESLQVLEEIAKFNNQTDKIQEIRKIMETESVRDSESEANIQNVYKSIKEWKYLKSIILLTFIYGISNLYHIGISYSYEEEGFGFGYNSILAGIIEIISFIFIKWTVKKVPRKVGISFFYAIIMVLGFSFLFSYVKENVYLTTLLLGISKLSSMNAYCLIACMETESFEVSIQSTATGMIEVFALYGSLVAPSIVNVALHIGIDPIAMVALFVNFGIWPTYFLKETFEKSKS